MSRPTLSVVVIAKDEERLLADCLESARGLVDEVLCVIDDRTQDRTAEIARVHGARLGSFTYDEQAGALATARNTALDLVETTWALHLDADERLTPYGRYAIAMALDEIERGARVDGFAPLLENRRLDGTTTSIGPVNVRLARVDSRIRWYGRLHSELRIDGAPDAGVWRLIVGQPSIVHLGYDPTFLHDRAKVDRNLRLLRMDVADNPRDGQAHAYLAELYAQLGQMAEARRCAGRALASGLLRRTEQIRQMQHIRKGRAA
jgi:glycosyltransferase involved in cell wall biosynthesis